ncbi:MAG: glycosyltransferase family 4 protein [Rhodocyclaceae bacterium]|nr:glycosyltransferase family 4 protein [Rhodocyclaceae bacterium]
MDPTDHPPAAAPADAAIYFAADAYTTSGRAKLMGRHAAGEGFLRALARDGTAPIDCYSANRREAAGLASLAKAWGSARPVRWIPHGQLAGLRPAGALFYPGPNLGDLAWQRRRLDPAAYSLTGVTHTTASHGATDAIADLLTAPLEPWDALVCTSRAVVDSVRRLWAAEGEWLRERLGAGRVPEPLLAEIPLGADCAALAPDAALRAHWRRQLEVGPDEVVFLFLGRLSFHAKANPLPMFLALEHAARESGKPVRLVMAGWFANEFIERAFREGAERFCPSVRLQVVDGRQDEIRNRVWQAADVFVSLADNIQETFGLTPVEAMAAGLPCVVSDWDGYRGTVRDGEDGFRIPTRMPPAGLGADLAARHADGVADYDRYIGEASLFVAVDVEATQAACLRLAADADLRRRLGESARRRALEVFDWGRVLARYRELWRELADRRRAAPPAGAPRLPPRRADPYWLFAGYATGTMAGDLRLRLAPGGGPEALARLADSPLVNFGRDLLPTSVELGAVLEVLAGRPGAALADCLAPFPEARRPLVLRGIAWLHKVGLVAVVPA